MRKNSVHKIVFIGLLIGLQVILSRFLSIATPIVKIGFSFLPVVITAIMYGPIYAGIGSALGDFLGSMLFPIAKFFPGFTFSSFLSGVVYGIFLHNKPKQMWRVLCAVFIVNVAINLFLNTFWLYIIYGQGFLALMPTRVIQNLIMILVKVVTIWNICYRSKLGSGLTS